MQSNTILDWSRNWGLYVISDSDINTPVPSETFRIRRLNLNLDTNHSYEDLGLYDWKKYNINPYNLSKFYTIVKKKNFIFH